MKPERVSGDIYVFISYDSSRKIRANLESGSAMMTIVIAFLANFCFGLMNATRFEPMTLVVFINAI